MRIWVRDGGLIGARARVCVYIQLLLYDTMFTVEYRICKVLFVEMYVNVVFVKLFVQHSEFNSC